MATQQFNTNVDVNGEVKGTSLDINGAADISGNLELQADLDVSGTITGDGSGVDSINASNISSGTLASARVGTLNQNTTGSAATLTTARTIAGVSFNGSANIALNNQYIANGAGYTGDQSQSDINALAITAVGTIGSGEWRGTRISTVYQYQRQTFDFKGYSTHDGTNYEIPQAMTDTNAPFEHNTSVGSAGTTAINVSLLLRAGGHVMPYAGTIKKWTGWAAGSGSGTINLALFRYRPDPTSSSQQSLVLIDDQALTAAGAQTVDSIEQTSFTDGDIAAGDIIMTGIKGVSGKTTYFTSTMEIEWD